MTFNQFQKELQRRGISPENAYMFTLIYERLIAIGKDVEDNASALLAMANNMQNFVTLNEQTQQRITKVEKGQRPDGIEVKSEPVN